MFQYCGGGWLLRAHGSCHLRCKHINNEYGWTCVHLSMCIPVCNCNCLGCCIGHFLEPGAHKGNASWLMLGLCTCKLQGGHANKHWDLTSKQLHICTPWCFAIAKHWSQPQAMTDTARLGTCSALFVYPRDGGQDSSGPPAGVSTPISTTHS